MAMGFPDKKCRKALRECDGNLERAMEWIFSHMDDDGEDEEMPAANDGGANPADLEAQMYKDDKPGIYSLQSFITHLGSSVHAGHYVAHIRGKDGRWVIFDDEKVAHSKSPPVQLAYLYLYARK